MDAFKGGRRSDFVDEWSKLIPKNNVQFNKELNFLVYKDDGKVSLQFKDGSVEEADVGNVPLLTIPRFQRYITKS